MSRDRSRSPRRSNESYHPPEERRRPEGTPFRPRSRDRLDERRPKGRPEGTPSRPESKTRSSSRPVRCYNCDATFTNHHDLHDHVRQKRTCRLCQDRVCGPQGLNSHLSTSHWKSDKPCCQGRWYKSSADHACVQCEQCKKWALGAQDLKSHQCFKCSLCNKLFFKKEYFDHHTNVQCQFCDTSVSSGTKINLCKGTIKEHHDSKHWRSTKDCCRSRLWGSEESHRSARRWCTKCLDNVCVQVYNTHVCKPPALGPNEQKQRLSEMTMPNRVHKCSLHKGRRVSRDTIHSCPGCKTMQRVQPIGFSVTDDKSGD